MEYSTTMGPIEAQPTVYRNESFSSRSLGGLPKQMSGEHNFTFDDGHGIGHREWKEDSGPGHYRSESHSETHWSRSW